METDDIEAVLAVRRGDIDAFAMLVHKYTGQVTAFVATKTKDRDLADDTVQVAFINLYKAIDRLDMQKPVLPYLFQIAKNELYTQWRKQKRIVSLNEAVAHAPAAPMEETVRMGEVTKALGQLKPDQRSALTWFAQGYSYMEIAQKMGRPINTIRTLIRRARLFILRKESL